VADNSHSKNVDLAVQMARTFSQVSHKLVIIVTALTTRYRSSRHLPLALRRVLPARPLRRSVHVPDGGDKRVEQARVVAVAGDPAQVVVQRIRVTPRQLAGVLLCFAIINFPRRSIALIAASRFSAGLWPGWASW